MFSVTVEGLDEIERDWGDAQRALSDGLRLGVRKGVDEGAAEARRTHRFQNRTGEAERNTVGRVLGETHGAAVGEIACEVPYASYLSDGTRDHDIEPKRSRVLAWENPEAQGDWHFARKVHHPGTKPDPFMGNAYLKAERVVVREVDVAVERAVKIMER